MMKKFALVFAAVLFFAGTATEETIKPSSEASTVYAACGIEKLHPAAANALEFFLVNKKNLPKEITNFARVFVLPNSDNLKKVGCVLKTVLEDEAS